MSIWAAMDCTTAQSILRELLGLLPPHQWWLLRETREGNLGLAKAFYRPCAEIDALLINGSILKVNGNVVSLNRKEWETFHEFLPHLIKVGTKARVHFVTNGVHPEYDAPAKQLKAKGRNRSSTEVANRHPKVTPRVC